MAGSTRNRPVYADHASTSYPTLFPPVCNEVWANPSNSHSLGAEARDALRSALARIATRLNAPIGANVVVTANGTEADNLVLQGYPWDYIVTALTEHNAVHLTVQYLASKRGMEVFYVPVDGTGAVNVADVERIVLARPRTAVGLISLMYVNNETGTIQDLGGIAAMLRHNGCAAAQTGGNVWFHTDAVQAPGHVPSLDVQALGVDFLCISAHKFHGPPGIGFLFQRRPDLLRPIMFGGHQQGGLRPGTEPVALVRAMATAFEDATAPEKVSERLDRMRTMTAAIWHALAPFIVAGLVIPTGAAPIGAFRAPHHVSFCVRNGVRRILVQALEDRGVLVSGGSACNSDASLPSHVLSAMEIDPTYIHGSVRITLSHTNTMAEVQSSVIPALVAVLSTVPS